VLYSGSGQTPGNSSDPNRGSAGGGANQGSSGGGANGKIYLA
jgi:hypothetical protein